MSTMLKELEAALSDYFLSVCSQMIGSIDHPNELEGRFERLYGRPPKELSNKKEFTDVWETGHLQKYIRHLEKEFGSNVLFKVLAKFKFGKTTVSRLTSEPVQNLNKHPKIVDALAELHGTSRLECFYYFLEFCRDKSLPLVAFRDSQRFLKDELDRLKPYIDELRKKREYEQKKNSNSGRSFDGLSIAWEKGNNDHEKPVCTITPCWGENHLSAPDTTGNIDLEQPSTVLGWSSLLTPRIVGRDKEQEHLKNWIESGTPKSVQLISGDGGVGKTRLAFDFAKEISAAKFGYSAGQTGKNFRGQWHIGNNGILLIVDYPEERKESVKQLLRAFYDFDMESLPCGDNFRLLLLSRDRDFFDVIEEEAPRLSNKPIHLEGLKTSDDQWMLLNDAWEALQKLKLHFAADDQLDEEFLPLLLAKADFISWQAQDSNSTTPLMIIALAYYLFCEPKAIESSFVDLTSQNIIRYMTKREIKFIRKEVEESFALKKPWTSTG